jgi:undecaprenyl-diphosphatase
MLARRGRGAAGWLPVLACVLLFALFAWQLLATGPLTHADAAVTARLAAHRRPGLTQAMLLVSTLHESGVLLAITALLAAWFGWRHHPRWVLALLVVPSGMLVNVGLKHLFQRARPVLEQPLVHYTTYSFPSGHGTGATVFYGALCALVFAHTTSPRKRALAVAGAVAMVLLVCFSRVYLGAHYLTDVAASVCVGLAWLAVWLVGWVREATPPMRR